MPEALSRLNRAKLYEQVVERIKAHVEESGLHAGDKLPSERDLAERLGVSRASIKQAIVVLEVQGLLESRHGGGTYLRNDHLDVEPVDELVARRSRLPEVLEAREAMETKLAELAALRRTDEDLAAIDAALEFMKSEIEDGGHGAEGDRRFHEAITAAAKNALLAEFMRSIDTQIAESRNESLRQPGRPWRSLSQHQRIAEAIREGAPKAAATAMRQHVQTVSKVRLLTWDPQAD
ncbi:FadR/GntR family transcriptional regulator [Amycolatopsis keratiniphila]|uniref:GntR family transcriptional regulator n=1 Tax=Amycolatopsis keratiniphila subsp. keratiniphila TaxID=227715 RepID=A0A1W2M3D8_9PSEU|nr:FadR/GntR family transcriptional regulator [Amycolatopsis keratiniphila]OLZ49741.1 GntR family transcriptional regulator [Amycolatopsis keratiniphila subsp. nogabecina]ONF74572.1 GntR family transcriptional regulator [Amycolatopsis keratiniphila subsp. keratiniphila]SDU23579.1 transcriptional regulator, GntR family [Amycolatopsis keratiniphila]